MKNMDSFVALKMTFLMILALCVLNKSQFRLFTGFYICHKLVEINVFKLTATIFGIPDAVSELKA